MRKKLLFALLSMLLLPLGLRAQSVTVEPNTGKLIAALTTGDETGFEEGFSAMWRHEQLPLTFTVSDFCNLLESGELRQPAGNMTVYNNKLIITGGWSPDNYMCLSLPKGYRFKGYTIVLANNLVGKTVLETSLNSTSNKIFYETSDLSYRSSTTSMNYDYVYDEDEYADILSDIQEGDPHYLAVAKKGDDGPYVMPAVNEPNAADYYTITRTSQTDNDMGNHLYFRLSHSDATDIYGLTIISFTVYFTAESTFVEDAKPQSKDAVKSFVMSPFKTNKIDIGAVQTRRKNNATYYAYTYQNVKDLDAYIYIYQKDAILKDNNGNSTGIPSDVATTKKIHPVTIDGKNYFAFENGVYYVESPTEVYTPTGLSCPIGFRIVGAKFTPLWSNKTVSSNSANKTGYLIHDGDWENRRWYLNSSLRYTSSQFGWEIDEHHNIKNPSTGQYLACEGTGNTRTLSWSTNPNNPWNLKLNTDNGTVYYYSDGGNFYYLNIVYNQSPTVILNLSSSDRAQVQETTISYRQASYSAGNYTLKIYKKDAKDETDANVLYSKTVTKSSDAGTTINTQDYDPDFNNDAVKFEISGLQNGKQALVDVSLMMQTLNPYIDQMNIVCHDPDNQLSLSQNFTAENFMVSGGKFKFYIPSTYAETDLTFTFSDLWSQYGDNTYYDDTEESSPLRTDGNARYSFVTSSYFEPIDQRGDDGLYANAYNPNAPYTNKVIASKAGNIRFKFNNAEDLQNTNSAGTATNYLKEYPFTADNYIGSNNPDGGNTKGAFIDCTMNAKDSKSAIFYVFTADETRYNIAPSSAWQHRYYAFYRMDIDLETDNYDPQLTWTKIYNNTCYEKNGKDVTEDMWGLKLNTIDHTTQEPVTGYLTVKEIDDAIEDALGQPNCPKNADQILYVDGSDLYSIINSNVTSGGETTTMTLETLKEKFAKNVLFYLPNIMKNTEENFVFKPTGWTAGNAFQAGKDIILYDKQPFFAPFDIQVDGDNYATYTRLITDNRYGKDVNASIMLPFTLSLTNGIHTNDDNSCTFTVNELRKKKENEPIKIDPTIENPEYYGVAYFMPLNTGTTEANKPYMINVNSAPDGTEVSFIAKQKGSLVKATPTTGITTATNYTGQLIPDKVTSVEFNNVETDFTINGTYSGSMFDRTDNCVFYFANQQFVSMKELASSRKHLYVYPFRGIYKYPSGDGSREFSLKRFRISYDEPEDDITGINDNKESDTDLMVRTGKGSVTITTTKAQEVTIYSANGSCAAKVNMQGGDTQTVSLPSGLYIVNNVKIGVK